MSSRDFNGGGQLGYRRGRRWSRREDENRIPRRPPAGNRRVPLPQFDDVTLVLRQALQLSIWRHRTTTPLHSESLLQARLRITEVVGVNFPSLAAQSNLLDVVIDPEQVINVPHLRLPQFPGFFVVPVNDRATRNSGWARNHVDLDWEREIARFWNLGSPQSNSIYNDPGVNRLGGRPPSNPLTAFFGDRARPRLSQHQELPDLSNIQLGERMLYIRCFIMDLLLPELVQVDITSLLGLFRTWMREHPENPDIPLEQDLTTTIGCIYFLISVLEDDIPLLEGHDQSDNDQGNGHGRFNRWNGRNHRRHRLAHIDCSIHGSNLRLDILTYLKGVVSLFFQYAEASYEFALRMQTQLLGARLHRSWASRPSNSGASGNF